MPDLREAWDKAFATDKQAPFGGIIICNRPLTEPLARAISEIFTEVIIAPEFEPDARALLQKKKNLRLMRKLPAPPPRRAGGGPRHPLRRRRAARPEPRPLARDAGRDRSAKSSPNAQPTPEELAAMLFAWRVVKHVKSNAIVFAGADRTLGIGAGQMSRVDACRIAIWKAADAGLCLKGSAVGSDAFFPFPDGLIAAAEAGATCAIQPGGSVRDPEVIAAADEREHGHDLHRLPALPALSHAARRQYRPRRHPAAGALRRPAGGAQLRARPPRRRLRLRARRRARHHRAPARRPPAHPGSRCPAAAREHHHAS